MSLSFKRSTMLSHSSLQVAAALGPLEALNEHHVSTRTPSVSMTSHRSPAASVPLRMRPVRRNVPDLLRLVLAQRAQTVQDADAGATRPGGLKRWGRPILAAAPAYGLRLLLLDLALPLGVLLFSLLRRMKRMIKRSGVKTWMFLIV